MIFFDQEGFWQRNPVCDQTGKVIQPGMNVEDLVGHAIRAGTGFLAEKCLEKLVFTADASRVLAILGTHAGAAVANMVMTLGGRPLDAALSGITTDRLTRAL